MISFKVKIGDVTVELDEKDARALYAKLNELFGVKEVRYDWGHYPWYVPSTIHRPYITWTSDTISTKTVSNSDKASNPFYTVVLGNSTLVVDN